MIIDGKKIAADIVARVRERAQHLPEAPHVVALVEDETPATRSYLAIKKRRAEEAGCRFDVRTLERGIEQVIQTAEKADAVVIQLPIRDALVTREWCDAIPAEKDADVLSSAAREKFEQGVEGALLPPVVGAVKAVLQMADVVVSGKHVVVVGQGFLVGAPVATWLKQQGADVSVVTEGHGDLGEALRNADIVVLGAGSPGLVTPDMLNDGVVLIDAGTSESNGKIVGDADPACAPKCSVFTPVPGGIGPVAVACLFENVVTLCEGAR